MVHNLSNLLKTFTRKKAFLALPVPQKKIGQAAPRKLLNAMATAMIEEEAAAATEGRRPPVPQAQRPLLLNVKNGIVKGGKNLPQLLRHTLSRFITDI